MSLTSMENMKEELMGLCFAREGMKTVHPLSIQPFEQAKILAVKALSSISCASAEHNTFQYTGGKRQRLMSQRSAILHADPRTVITPSSSNDNKLCAFNPQSTETAGTALLSGSDHSFEDFEYC